MSVMTVDDIKQRIVEILPISSYDNGMYDGQLDILIRGAINKMRNEGVDIEAQDKEGNYIFDNDSYDSEDYCLCIGYQLMKDIDFDTDMNFMTEQYITRVNTIRCNITKRQR